MTELKWITREKEDDYPTEPGVYAIMVRGDSESIDGHVIYEFDDYETMGSFSIDSDGGKSLTGQHDEPDETIFAYYGPIVIPPYKSKA